MNRIHLFVAIASAAAIAGCKGEEGTGTSGTSEPIESVAPPAGQTWEQMVTETAAGGYQIGNPEAQVKLVEFASLTCPHCADFDENVDELVDEYVKTGQVSYEFRNFVRDPFDVAGSLVTRCGGADRFFPLTHAMFETQDEWVTRLQEASPQQMQAVTNLGPERQFVEIAELAGFKEWAAQRGITEAQVTQCLSDQAEINQLVQMRSDAGQQFAIPGTPSFLINGELVENASTWEALEPKLREALGG